MACPLSVRHTTGIEEWTTERGERRSLPLSFFLKRQWNTKKAYQPKCTTKLTNQPKPFAPTWKMNCFLELSVPFVTFGATMFFYAFVFCSFVSLTYSSSEPHKHGSVATGSPPEGRKNSLAMYKKEQVKPKMLFLMSFLYCSLVSFFVTVIIWRFPNCTKRHGNEHT